MEFFLPRNALQCKARYRDCMSSGCPSVCDVGGSRAHRLKILRRLEVGWGKVVCWNTKAAISLKRIKIEKSYHGRPIGTQQCCFEWQHPRPAKASSSPRLGVRNPTPKLQSTILCPQALPDVYECPKIVCKRKISRRLHKNRHITILSLFGGKIIFEVFQPM